MFELSLYFVNWVVHIDCFSYYDRGILVLHLDLVRHLNVNRCGLGLILTLTVMRYVVKPLVWLYLIKIYDPFTQHFHGLRCEVKLEMFELSPSDLLVGTFHKLLDQIIAHV
jgi:hypothetical protein